MEPLDHYYLLNAAGKYGEYYLYYFSDDTPKEWEFKLPDERLKNGMKFKAELIDTWNMTITPVKQVYEIEMKDRYSYVDKRSSKDQIARKTLYGPEDHPHSGITDSINRDFIHEKMFNYIHIVFLLLSTSSGQ